MRTQAPRHWRVQGDGGGCAGEATRVRVADSARQGASRSVAATPGAACRACCVLCPGIKGSAPCTSDTLQSRVVVACRWQPKPLLVYRIAVARYTRINLYNRSTCYTETFFFFRQVIGAASGKGRVRHLAASLQYNVARCGHVTATVPPCLL